MRDSTPVIGIREPGALDLVQILIQQGISVRIRVSGDSMQPLLKGGETVEVSPPPACLRLGDILFLCDQRGNPLVHRLIWRRSREGVLFLLTKGDACANFDGFFPAEQVVGQVQRVIIADSERVLGLQTPLMRWRAMQIVSRALLSHAWRKVIFFFCGRNAKKNKGPTLDQMKLASSAYSLL